jgi:hypothetical protein
MLHTLRLSFQNAAYFIMLPFFGFSIIHILHTECAKNLNVKFKVFKSVHHRTIQINHPPDATVF